ncbi:MAG: acyltransferase [Firmicutes bacterium]|nr:acyltransferase [Bacillota bacterium]
MERQSKEHLYEVDLMRAFIILGVVCVHITSFYNTFATNLSSTDIVNEMLLVALHFTRESFMFITGLVLFITYYHRTTTFSAVSFWKKRFALIFIPYAAWTLIYILFTGTYAKGFDWSFGGIVGNFFFSLLTGHQFYLYYLVISMQLYILFPLLLKFIRKTASYHGWVFAFSFVLQISMMWFNKSVLQNMSTAHMPEWIYLLVRYRDRDILIYQFWFISGAILAVHYQAIKSYIVTHKKWIFGSMLVALLLLWVHYAFDRFVLGQDSTMSVLVLQPVMIPYSVATTVTLWTAGMSWSAVRLKASAQWFSKFVKIAAAASFGVFLVHPILLHYAEVIVYHLHPSTLERAFLQPLTIIVVYTLAIVIARAIGNVPWLSYIVGQKTQAPKWFTPRSQPTPSVNE